MTACPIEPTCTRSTHQWDGEPDTTICPAEHDVPTWNGLVQHYGCVRTGIHEYHRDARGGVW